MKTIYSLFFALVLTAAGCASSSEIVFPEMPLGDCPDGSVRTPSSECGTQQKK